MMMLSGGIDSPVAAYLAMKRGVSLEMVHFYSPPYTSEQALAKSKELTSKLANIVVASSSFKYRLPKFKKRLRKRFPRAI